MVLGTRKGVQGVKAGVIDESTAYRSTLPNLIVRLTLTSISLKTPPRASPFPPAIVSFFFHRRVSIFSCLLPRYPPEILFLLPARFITPPFNAVGNARERARARARAERKLHRCRRSVVCVDRVETARCLLDKGDTSLVRFHHIWRGISSLLYSASVSHFVFLTPRSRSRRSSPSLVPRIASYLQSYPIVSL